MPATAEVRGHDRFQTRPCRFIRTWRARCTPTGVNQLWVADITYIRLEVEFVYLAVILDAFSRRVIGWALDRTLEAELAMASAADGAR